MKKIIIILLSLCLNLFAQSEIPELITDRPDQTESAAVVPLNCYQIETGILYQHQKYDADGINFENQNVSLLSTLFRYGMNSSLELRLGGGFFSNLSRFNESDNRVDGFGDLMIGAKYIVRKDQKILTNIGVLWENILPFGSLNFRPEKIEPKILLLLEQEINESLGVGINLGGEYSSSEEKTFYDYTTTLGISLTNRLGGFVEFYGQTSKESSPENHFDFGITYQHTQNIQLDLSLGSIIQSGVQDYFIGFGFSIRFLN